MLVCFAAGMMVAVFRQAGMVACARLNMLVKTTVSWWAQSLRTLPPFRACGLSDIHSFRHLCYLMGLQSKRVVRCESMLLDFMSNGAKKYILIFGHVWIVF